jgi:hypothetical protein
VPRFFFSVVSAASAPNEAFHGVGGDKPLEIQFDEEPFFVSIPRVSPICSAIGHGFFLKNSK